MNKGNKNVNGKDKFYMLIKSFYIRTYCKQVMKQHNQFFDVKMTKQHKKCLLGRKQLGWM
jgi:hypothetical protein